MSEQQTRAKYHKKYVLKKQDWAGDQLRSKTSKPSPLIINNHFSSDELRNLQLPTRKHLKCCWPIKANKSSYQRSEAINKRCTQGLKRALKYQPRLTRLNLFWALGERSAESRGHKDIYWWPTCQAVCIIYRGGAHKRPAVLSFAKRKAARAAAVAFLVLLLLLHGGPCRPEYRSARIVQWQERAPAGRTDGYIFIYLAAGARRGSMHPPEGPPSHSDPSAGALVLN